MRTERSLLARSALAAVVALTGAGALSASDLQPGDEPISLDEWRAMTEGKTLYYSLRGEHWGMEYFHPDRDSATFVTRDGECVTAPWVYADGVFCFAYSGMDCFRHVRRGDALLAIPLGAGSPEQTIERIVTRPLSCEAPLSS